MSCRTNDWQWVEMPCSTKIEFLGKPTYQKEEHKNNIFSHNFRYIDETEGKLYYAFCVIHPEDLGSKERLFINLF